MSANENPRAANTGASALQSAPMSPRATGVEVTALTRAEAIAAADEATHLRLLAALLDRLTYSGRTVIGYRHHFAEHGTERPVYATRRSVRQLVGPDLSDPTVDRLVVALAEFADQCEFELSVRLTAFTVDRACALTDDAEDADLRAHIAEQQLGVEVLAATRRHPSARRFCRAGGVR